MSSPLHAAHVPARIAHNYGQQSAVDAPLSPSAHNHGAAAVGGAARSNRSPGLLLMDHAAPPVSPSAQARAQTMVAHLTGAGAAAAASSGYAALGNGYAAAASSPSGSPVGSPSTYATGSPTAGGGRSPKQTRPALLTPMWTSSAPPSPSAAAAAPASSSALPYSTPIPVSAADPQLVIRRAQAADYSKGHVALLAQLTTVGQISAADYAQRTRLFERHGELLHCLVIEDVSCGAIIASATLVVEPKFVHSCGLAGHIEDVVVSERYRGKNLGHKILAALHEIARAQGCYKVMLDCAASNTKFYEKIGYTEKEKHMRLDL